MSERANGPAGQERRWLPPIGLLLLTVVLIPTLGMAMQATSSAATRWSQRSAAVSLRRDADAMDQLILLRGKVTAEYVNAASVATGADLGLDTAKLSAFYHFDFAAQMKSARAAVDADTTRVAFAGLQSDLAGLHSLRADLDAGRLHFADVDVFFTKFDGNIDTLWQGRLDAASKLTSAAERYGDSVSRQLHAIEATFDAFRTAFERTSLASALLTGKNTPANIEALVAASTRFAANVADFSGQLGPKAAIAWRNVKADPAGRQFDAVVDRAVKAGISDGPRYVAVDPGVYGAELIAAGKWVVDLTSVNAAASLDLKDFVGHLEATALRSLLLESFLAAAAVLLTTIAAVLTARAVARPARRLAAAARQISAGELSISPLPIEGTRELAETSRALNDMAATLTALERYAVTLAEQPLSTTLNEPLPGRTGRALQVTLDHLQDSIHEREHDRAALQRASTHDDLTGLLNRGAALEAITRDLARSRRDNIPLMVLFIDLDAFKLINDTYGHQIGDDALRITADALRAEARGSDVIARLGGDEFLVSGFAVDPAEVESIARRVHDAISARVVSIGEVRLEINSSIGIALAESDDTAESIVRRADLALYRAKRGGRDQVAWPDRFSRTSH